MSYDRSSFIDTLKERIEIWDYGRFERFIERHRVTLKDAGNLEKHWDESRQVIRESFDHLSEKVPYSSTLDDLYMAKLLAVIFERALVNMLKRKEEAQQRASMTPSEAVVVEQKSKASTMQPALPEELFEAGSFIGDYEVVQKLGEGAMGVVYLTQHHYLKKLFAVKVLSRKFSQRPEFAQVFLNEARTLGNLKHPNLVEVFNFGVHEELQYLVMEYVNSGNVERYRVDRGGKLSAEEVQATLESVLLGLEHAHGYGVIHRDLKPENLMLSEDGVVKISDFGLAYLCESDMSETERLERRFSEDTWLIIAEEQSKVGVFTGGTQGYMAPEVAKGEAGDKRADFYAIGAIAYVLLTGGLPAQERVPVSEVVEGLDPRWDGFIDRCLEPDPEARYQDARELLEDLRGIDIHIAPVVKKSHAAIKYLCTGLLGVLIAGACGVLFWPRGVSVSVVTEQAPVEKMIASPAVQTSEVSELVYEDEPIVPAVVAVAPVGLVENGSFEEGFDGWQLLMMDALKTCIQYNPEEAREGEGYAVLVPIHGGTGWARMQTRLTAMPDFGQRLRVSVSARKLGEASSDPAVFALTLRGVQSYPYTEVGVLQRQYVVGDAWQTIVFDCTIPQKSEWAGVDYLELEFELSDFDAGFQELWLDAVDIVRME